MHSKDELKQQHKTSLPEGVTGLDKDVVRFMTDAMTVSGVKIGELKTPLDKV